MAKNTKDLVVRTLLNIAAEEGPVNIEEITRRTGITRNTIKNNFGNGGISDILQYIYLNIFDKLNKQLFRHNPDELPVEIFADIFLDVLWQYKDEVHILVTSNLLFKRSQIVTDLSFPWVQKRYEKLVKDHNLAPNFTAKQLLLFWSSYLDAIAVLWFTSKIPLEPKQFKPIFLKLIETSMYDLIYTEIGH